MARRCLDPLAEAVVEEGKGEGEFPEYIALVNPIAKNAFAMRFDGALRVTCTKMLYTTRRDGDPFPDAVSASRYTTQAKVCDAFHIRAFSVRLLDGSPSEYVRRLWAARLTLLVDGEALADGVPLKELLGMREYPIPRPVDGRRNLFDACLIDEEQNAIAEEWLGHMLPNGSEIEATVEGVPGGGGLVKLAVSFVLGRYTTKKKEGSPLGD
jgi:hypothetical protein